MNREPYKILLKDNRKLVIEYDADAQSPDTHGDENLYLTHDHRQFAVRHDETKEVVNYLNSQNPNNREEDEERDTSYDDFWIFTVAAYIHSGVCLSLGSGSHFPDRQWDVSHCGFVLASKNEWPEKSDAHKCAEGLISSWNEYLGGEVYGYTLYNRVEYTKTFKDGRPAEEGFDWEEEDSCWGYYGDDGIETIISENDFQDAEEPKRKRA